ncbi:[FeFe] hydrogenase H-cluster radical SAM maturase HydE [Plebeiibacterium sediminum]|uniref:[FeFe] hydrogenase H-cluster radical SAM maturase HydE n=1 Tax=Plebeiibacterium sediminum TaxID=2992112 RepID=A0AAE3M9T2_9BACT|nr:[FeFe] hydrogenase H-cluster radical SAM maturase HydE [Plebeiobacterium sediminum]MCW3789607.1 [FeFe] hydrogenase H-cluster radical SAM maturase HydE [Plebeiobacterium sediminum]
MTDIQSILDKEQYSVEDITTLLQLEGDNQKLLFKKSEETQLKYVGNKVFYRGLVEFSNVCAKNCYYCGIRKDNNNVERYNIEDKDIIEAAIFAWKNRYASMVIQGGERSDEHFINRIDHLIQQIKKETNGDLGITLSLGEQTLETYQKWYNSGAHRYLLRIESSNQNLYEQIHPKDQLHDYNQRIEALKSLRKAGYQVGTGVMVGLPGQTFEDLANDLLFMKEIDIDMCGMGPYIEHKDTPLFERRGELWPIKKRFSTTLNMIAMLRIIMKDINIAAATALQAIDPMGREKALKIGANVIMPNITPTFNRKNYQLYENKPCTDEGAEDCGNCLSMRIELANREIGLGEWGDSKHYFKRKNK